MTEIGNEVNRILQYQTNSNEDTMYSKKFASLFHSSVRAMVSIFPDSSIVFRFLANPTDENNCLSFIEMLTEDHNLQEISQIRTNLENRITHYRKYEK